MSGCSSERLKQLDLFAEAPKLNFLGRASYQTTLGGLLSVTMYVLILIPSILEVNKLLGRGEPIV